MVGGRVESSCTPMPTLARPRDLALCRAPGPWQLAAMEAAADQRRSDALQQFARSTEQAVRDELALLSTELRSKRDEVQRLQSVMADTQATLDSQQRLYSQRLEDLRQQVPLPSPPTAAAPVHCPRLRSLTPAPLHKHAHPHTHTHSTRTAHTQHTHSTHTAHTHSTHRTHTAHTAVATEWVLRRGGAGLLPSPARL
jgi:hypothetical protein